MGLNYVGSTRFVSEKFLGKKRSGRIMPEGKMHDPPTPTQKIVGLKLCWVVVSLGELAYKISDH